ncbi:MAG: polysaccharide biosynthesis PFTS motif protein [Lentimonas sp.]|jgi:polysaccharide biosynthesis PFTS motif protein
MKRMLFIESIGLWQVPFILILKLIGVRVAVFDTTFSISSKARFRWLIRFGLLERIISHHASLGDTHSRSIQMAEEYVKNYCEKIVQSADRLFEHKGTDRVFMRTIAEHLVAAESVFFVIEEEKERLGKSVDSFYFLASSEYVIAKGIYSRLGKELPIPPRVTVIRAFFPEWLDGLRSLLGLSFMFFAYALNQVIQVFRSSHQPEQEVREYGVSLSAPFLTKFRSGGPRNYDFLVDDKHLTREDIVFLVEYSEQESFIQSENIRGNRLVNVYYPGLRGVLAPTILSFRHELLSIPMLFKTVWSAPIRDACVHLLRARLIWGGTLARLKIRHYIYTNKEGATQIAANVLMRALDIESWCYSMFVGGPYQSLGAETPFDGKHVAWSFLNPNVFFLNNQAMADSMKSHFHDVEKYHVVGNVFSELISKRDVQEARGEFREEFPHLMTQDQRWIGVFDTSYVDIPASYSTFEEAAGFLDDFHSLAITETLTTFLFKPSKTNDYFVNERTPWASARKGIEVIKARNRLAELPNVIFLEDNYDPASVIVICDVVITNCFSSPTADALAAGVPAFWYQAITDVGSYPLTKVQGLVAQGPKELLESINRCYTGTQLELLYSQNAFRVLVNAEEKPSGLADMLAALISDRTV